jgi:Na+/H+-dicarboxylate symporter
MALGLLLKGRAEPLGVLGNLLIQAVKILASPLLFIAVTEAVIKTTMKITDFRRLATMVLINAVAALVIAYTLASWLVGLVSPDALNTVEGATASIKVPNFGESIKQLVPQSLAHPFLEHSVFTLVIFAFFLGWAVKAVKRDQPELGQKTAQFEGFLAVSFQVLVKIIDACVVVMPIAVAGVIASVVGTRGLAPFQALAPYVLAVAIGLILQMLITYQAWLLWAGFKLKSFWNEVRHTLVYSFGVNSSLATLPLTLKSLERLKVSEHSSRLVACVGTNFNNDGILLYQTLAALFVSRMLGIEMSFGQELLLLGTCFVTTLGVAGVPEAGIVALSLVLSYMGVPTEVLAILLSVDWFLARLRSVVNVTADITGAVAVDHMAKNAARPRR